MRQTIFITMHCPLPCLPFVRKLTAMASLLGAAVPVGAAVIHVDLAPSPLSIPDGLDGIFLNFVTGGTSTSAVPLAGWDFNLYNNGSGLSFFGPALPSGQGTLSSSANAMALLGGEAIGGGGIYQPAHVSGTNFFSIGMGFAGLRFHNETTGQLNYGWAQLRTSAAFGFPAALLGYAYDDSGAPIIAGQVPEPGAGLLALSGVVLAGRRRRNMSKGAAGRVESPYYAAP